MGRLLQAHNNITAPTAGNYAGIAIYQDRRASSSSSNTINGGAGNIIRGAIYFPSSTLKINGSGSVDSSGNGVSLCAMWVARDINLTGNSSMRSVPGKLRVRGFRAAGRRRSAAGQGARVMLRTIQGLLCEEDGAAVIELALIAPVLALTVIGIVDMSNAYSRKLALEQAAQRAVEKIAQTTETATVEATLANEAICRQRYDQRDVQHDPDHRQRCGCHLESGMHERRGSHDNAKQHQFSNI